MFVAATGNQLLLRQYAIAFKKSGAQVPRTELTEMGPRMDFSIRRSRGAPDEIQTQSMKQPKLDKKKVGLQQQVLLMAGMSVLLCEGTPLPRCCVDLPVQ